MSELFRDTLESSGGDILQVTGGSFMAKVKAAWPQLVIIQSQWTLTTTGLLYPFNEQVVRRAVGITPRVIDWTQKTPLTWTMAALAKDVLAVPTPSALVAITGI